MIHDTGHVERNDKARNKCMGTGRRVDRWNKKPRGEIGYHIQK